jgi:hypothetical protein
MSHGKIQNKSASKTLLILDASINDVGCYVYKWRFLTPTIRQEAIRKAKAVEIK